MADVLLVQARGPIRIVTLNRPSAYNAADAVLHGAISRVWHELAADADVGAVVLTGAGKAFSAGGDLDLLHGMVRDLELRAQMMEEGIAIVRGMTELEVPIVAAVNGPAVGLGCSLASMSDLVLIEESAYLADPHVALGLVAADGGALTWPLLTSLLRAKEHILLGERLSAADAVQVGLANRVVPDGTSLDEAIAVAQRLAALPPQAVRATKALLNQAVRAAVATGLPAAIEAESASFDEPAFQANLERIRRRGRSR